MVRVAQVAVAVGLRGTVADRPVAGMRATSRHVAAVQVATRLVTRDDQGGLMDRSDAFVIGCRVVHGATATVMTASRLRASLPVHPAPLAVAPRIQRRVSIPMGQGRAKRPNRGGVVPVGSSVQREAWATRWPDLIGRTRRPLRPSHLGRASRAVPAATANRPVALIGQRSLLAGRVATGPALAIRPRFRTGSSASWCRQIRRHLAIRTGLAG